jgi:hypothetical protein
MRTTLLCWRDRRGHCDKFVGLVGAYYFSLKPNRFVHRTRATFCHNTGLIRVILTWLREYSFCITPCGGGIEYLHRDPASRRRRRKGKYQIRDSKIWSRVPRDSDQRKIALARASSICKRQTCPLVREGAPQEQDRNCHTGNKDLVISPKWVLYSETDWPADRRSWHKAQAKLIFILLVPPLMVSYMNVLCS